MLSSDESHRRSDELLLTAIAYVHIVKDGQIVSKFIEAANIVLESCPGLVPTPG